MVDIERLKAVPKEKIIFIDTETTGLDPSKDEVLSIAIIDGTGSVIFNELIRPEKRKRWPRATEIHGITWSDVKDKKPLIEYEDELSPYFSGSYIIVGYNVSFDIEMLEASGAKVYHDGMFDVMREFAKVHGRWSDWKEQYLWSKLKDCAKHYGYSFKAHDALEDVKATAFCFWRLLEDDEYIEEIAHEREVEERIANTNRVIAEALAEGKSKTGDTEPGRFDGCTVGCLLIVAMFLFALISPVLFGGK